MGEGNGYEAAVRTLIRLLHDGEKGLNEMARRMEAQKHRLFYQEEALVRGVFAVELERALTETIERPVQESGTLIGPAHRVYFEVKHALGAGDHGLLDSAELCERLPLRAYAEALKEELPEGLRRVLVRQAKHVERVHALLVRMREEAMSG